jgi:putative transposase
VGGSRCTRSAGYIDTVEELRRALLESRETYNPTRLIERHGFRPPDAVRRDQLSTAAPAA